MTESQPCDADKADYDNPVPSAPALWRVVDAAKAEVAAQGYRSTDMAKALIAVCGEFWYEEYEPRSGVHQ